MQRTDIAATLGTGNQYLKYTIGYTDLAAQTAATTPTTFYLATDPGGNSLQTPSTSSPPNAANFVIPQAGVIIYAKVHHTVSFSGGSLTAMTVSVGKVGGTATFVTPAFNVFQGSSDNTLQEVFNVASGQISPWGLTVTFTGDGTHNLSGATAGSVDIYIMYMNVSSPSE